MTARRTVLRDPSQSQARVGARDGRSSQDGVSQQQESAPLILPQLNRLHEAFLVRGEDASMLLLLPSRHRIAYTPDHPALAALHRP